MLVRGNNIFDHFQDYNEYLCAWVNHDFMQLGGKDLYRRENR